MQEILTGLGLSTGAGLNAYLPLLIAALAGRLGLIEFAEPYDVLTAWPVIMVLIILLLIEMIADKIPGVDHANDVLNTGIRPIAGALLMLASSSTIESVDPALLTASSVLAGGTSAGSVHVVKASVRPVVSVTTLGIGNAIISVIEDIISFFISVFVILIPFIAIFLAMSMVSIVAWFVWDRKRTRIYFGEKVKPAYDR